MEVLLAGRAPSRTPSAILLQSLSILQLRKLQKRQFKIRKFITGLGVVPSILDPIELHCDNNGATVQAKEPRSHQRSKHILRRFHLIREIVERGDVKICKIPGANNVADPLTK